MNLTAQQREGMRHALGLTRSAKAWRNHFVACDGSPAAKYWQELVAAGYATGKPYGGAPRSTIFFVTDEGRSALRKP